MELLLKKDGNLYLDKDNCSWDTPLDWFWMEVYS